MKTKLIVVATAILALCLLTGCKSTYTVYVNGTEIGTTKYNDNADDEIINPILVRTKKIDRRSKIARFTLVDDAKLTKDYTYKSKVAVSQYEFSYTTFIRVGEIDVPQFHNEYKITYQNYGLNGEVLGKNEEYVNYDVYKDFKKGAEKTTKLCAIKFNGKYYRVIEN